MILFCLFLGLQGTAISPGPFQLNDQLVTVTQKAATTLEAYRFPPNRFALDALRQGKVTDLSLTLPRRDSSFHATKVTVRDLTTSFFGQSEQGDQIVVTIGDAGFFAALWTADGNYTIELEDQAHALLVQRDPETRFQAFQCALEPSSAELQKMARGKDGEVACAEGNSVDVMVLYTSGMAARHGDNIQTRIQHLIDNGNLSLTNSEIETQLQLVHAEEVDYPDDSPTDPNDANNSDMSLALRDLTFNNGVFGNVEQLRDQYGADQVTLLRTFVDEGCGLAWVISSNTINGGTGSSYAVVHDGSSGNSFCSNLTYIHEVGHNFGCAHDRKNASSPGKYPYSYGYHDPNRAFHTVMAYRRFCGNCEEIPYFSNPDVLYNGAPTGVEIDQAEPAHNALTINQTRNLMARYRNLAIPSTMGERQYAPAAWTGDGRDTLLVLTNPSSSVVTARVFGLAGQGEPLASSDDLEIGPNQRRDFQLSDGFAGQNGIDWLLVASDIPLLAVAELQSAGVRSAYWASSELTSNLYVPHVAKNTGLFETIIAAINGTSLSLSADIRPEPFGDTVDLDQLDCVLGQDLQRARDLFGSDIEIVDWAELSTFTLGIGAMEYFSYLPDRDRTASLGLSGRRSDTLRFPHVAADTGQFWTGLVYMNVGNGNLDVSERYYGGDGTLIEERVVTLIRGQKQTYLFDDSIFDPSGTAWVEVSAPKFDLVGYELFGSANQSSARFFAGLEGRDDQAQSLLYPYTISGNGRWSGLVALNVGDAFASIRFDAYDASGTLIATANLDDIAPKSKVVRTLDTLFPSMHGSVAWVRLVASDSQWSGFSLWGDLGTPRENLSGIVAAIE